MEKYRLFEEVFTLRNDPSLENLGFPFFRCISEVYVKEATKITNSELEKRKDNNIKTNYPTDKQDFSFEEKIIIKTFLVL